MENTIGITLETGVGVQSPILYVCRLLYLLPGLCHLIIVHGIYRGFLTRMVYLMHDIEGFRPEWCISCMISRVFDQNGISHA